MERQTLQNTFELGRFLNGRLPGGSFCVRQMSHNTDISHTRTVVRECCKGDEASQWRKPKFDPPPRPNPVSDRNTNRVCTISATDHIGHNHIEPYRPQPHRPHEKTISAKTNNHIGHKNRTAILSSTFVSSQSKSKTRNVVFTPVSHKQRVKELNSYRHISKCFDVSIIYQ